LADRPKKVVEKPDFSSATLDELMIASEVLEEVSEVLGSSVVVAIAIVVDVLLLVLVAEVQGASISKQFVPSFLFVATDIPM